MPKTVLYIATSLDGYIARPDGRIDWLTSFPEPESGDYGYAGFLNSIEATIMGRKTYEEIIGFGFEWPYKGLDSHIVTRDPSLRIQSPDTHILSGSLKDFVIARKKLASRDIWLIGGGQLIKAFLNERLLDRMIITIVPRLIGEGIPLFPGMPGASAWTLAEATHYNNGAVTLTYDREE